MNNFNPPSKTNWCYSSRFDENFAKEYINGFNACNEGKELRDNPHKESKHERDTTYEDELHYWWYSGYLDGSE